MTEEQEAKMAIMIKMADDLLYIYGQPCLPNQVTEMSLCEVVEALNCRVEKLSCEAV